MLAVISNLEGGAGIPSWECNQEKFQFLIYFENTLPDPTVRLDELTACIIYMRDVTALTARAKSILQTHNLGTLLIERNSNKVVIEMPERILSETFSLDGQLNVIMKDGGPNEVNLKLSFPGRDQVVFKPANRERMDQTTRIFVDFINHFSWRIECAEAGKELPKPKPLITSFEREKLSEFPPHLIKAERIFNQTITTQSTPAPEKPKKKDNCIVM